MCVTVRVSTNLTEMPLESSSDYEADDSDAEFVEIDPSGRYGRVSTFHTKNLSFLLTFVRYIGCYFG